MKKPGKLNICRQKKSPLPLKRIAVLLLTIALAIPLCQAQVPVRPDHAIDDGLALTPPMGWYPWNIFGQEPQNEKLIREIVDALISSGMKDAGYSYAGPDEGICFSRGSDGKLTTNLDRYPSGLRGLGDYIHRKGLKYALYTDAGTLTCSKAMPGTKGYESDDMLSFAGWRADYIKIDWCNTEGQDIAGTYTTLHDAQHATGRPIVHSLCSWGDGEPWNWAASVGHLWRTGTDICAPGKVDWDLAMSITRGNEKLYPWAGPGHWNDPDMLITGMPGLSEVQNRAFFSLWCMMAAPLIAGNDLRDMSESTVRILTNPEAIAVNQDPLGVQGHILRTAGKLDIWAGKPLFDGSRALLIFNHGSSPETINIKLSEIGITQAPVIYSRDLWQHTTTKHSMGSGDVLSFRVEPNDVQFVRISGSNEFLLPPVIVADTYLISLTAGSAVPEKLTGAITLTNRGSSDLPLWRVSQNLPAWLSVSVSQKGKTQTIKNTVSTSGLKKGFYHSIVRLDNTEPVSGKPMSAVYYDVDLEVTGDIRGTTKSNEAIWQRKPGDSKLNWESQVFHLGNGYFGVSAYGGVKQEIITLSEKTFWTGGPGDRTDYNFCMVPERDFSYIGEIKKLTSEGNITEADKLVAKYLCNESWMKLGGLSTIGSLILNFENHDGEITEYERCLNLQNSTLVIKYKANGANYKREYFCSYPNRILAIRITSDKPNSVSFNLGLDLMHKKRGPQKTITPAAGLFEIAGNMDDNNRPYRVKIKVENQGGELSRNDSMLVIKGSNSVNIYYTAATDFELNPPLFRGADPDKIASGVIAAASSAGYDKLRETHISDYQRLYNRTSLHLENPAGERESLPTNERLFYYIYNNDVNDLGLKELAFNFGKYMLISVSRPGAMACGNQGTWNNKYQALWNGTYQLDMNVTQTYMFGNALNLPECQEPFIDYIKMLSKVGEKAAKGYYGTNGWVSYVISDLWGGAGTLPPAPFISTGWLSLILWEQYAFDKDEKYLKEIYPVLKGASRFYLENLIEYKDTKKLVFWGTYSAEHSSSLIGVTEPNFQDIAFAGETFENTIRASEILNTDKEFREQLNKAKGRLMPYKTGRMGQFQEWVEDIDDPNCQHRHLSHLLALQPCKQVNPHKEPALINAIKVTLKQRGDNDFVTLHRPDLGNSVLYPTKCRHEGLSYDYYTSQAWSRTARLCTWLRVFDGDHANKIYNDIFRESTLENMIQYETRAHYGDKPVPEIPFFIESTVLSAGYVTEMLLQTQYGELELLPALPSAWATGSIKGIRGRDACTVDIEWKDGELVHAGIRSDNGGKYIVRYQEKTKQVTLKAGELYAVNGSLE